MTEPSPPQAPLAQLDGRAAFITGGASGIGLGIAAACIGAGMRVVLADLRQDHIDAALERLDAGDRAHAIRLDVCDREAFAAAAQDAVAWAGSVHLLVNNAGIAMNGPIRLAGYADWDWGLAVLLGGPVNGIHSFLPHLLGHGEGAQIVCTASTSGVLPHADGAIYNTAKAAVVALCESIREELGDRGIGVSAFCPGPVRTNIHETGEIRPARYRATSGFAEIEQAHAQRPSSPLFMDPFEAGERMLRGVRANELYIFTHPEFRDGLEERMQAMLASFPDEPVDEARASSYAFLLHSRAFTDVLAAHGRST
jgi:NAD(P)-dependent dehydrogenase (short-subunit alcohol dehydrogenase family)